MVGAIAGAISPPNPISHWDRLYLAAERGYILSTERGSGAHRGKTERGGMDERGVFVCARGENRRSVRVASGEKGGMIGSDTCLRPIGHERSERTRFAIALCQVF